MTTSKQKARVEFEVSPEIAEAVERYATAKGMDVEEATGELVRAGLAEVRKLTPDEVKAAVERFKAMDGKGGAK